MKLLDIILEAKGRTKEEFLKTMKELFPYGKDCLYDFGDQEKFSKRSEVNVYCKKHNVNFPAVVDTLTGGNIGKDGCDACKKENENKFKTKLKDDFYNRAKTIWTGETGNPLYVYDRTGLKKYTGMRNTFDFYCPKIGSDGKPHGKQNTTASSHILPANNKPHYPYIGCKKCKEEQGLSKGIQRYNLSREEFIKKVKERMKLFHIPMSWYDWKGMEYKSPGVSGEIKCLKHNEKVYRQISSRFYTGTPLCPECNRIAVKQKNFMDKVRKLYNDRFVLLSDYIDSFSPVTLGCTLHGKKPYPVVVEYPSIIQSSTSKYGSTKNKTESIQCKECDRIKSLNNYKINFKNKHGKKFVNGKKLQYTYPDIDKEFINSTTKIPIICHVKNLNDREHGMFWQKPDNHSKGQGCPKCRESRNERHIQNLLEDNDIEFEREKKFTETGNLEYDFYLPKPYNVIIEYDGIQHFEPTFGNSDYSRQLTYNGLYESDNLKNKFVETNNLGLRMIRIPHTLKEGQYDELLLIELKKVVGKRKIKHIGDYPEREKPKQAVHPKKLNESKLTLIGVLKQIL
jgi:very-short-patch-repair endonuclease